MSDRVMIIMTSGPDTPHRCAAPFFYASVAVAMDYEVTMFFTMDGTLLLKRGLAETVPAKPGGKPISGFMRDAQQAGVRFLVCSASTELHDLTPGDLIDGIEMAGGAAMWELATDCRTVLTF